LLAWYRVAVDTEIEARCMQSLRIVVIALLALGRPGTAESATQSIVQTREVLTNPSIVTLAAAGFNEDFLIDLILNSRTQFDTSVSGLAGLAKQGLTERIIRVMLNRSDAKPGLSTGDGHPPPPSPDNTQGTAGHTRSQEPALLAIYTHTPYSGSVSFFWGFYQKRVGVGVASEGHDGLAQHLGAVYGSVIAGH
jgi:hypothetical protein